MKHNWWKSAYKQNHFVFKLGISILFVGFGLRLLFSQSSTVIPIVSDNKNNNSINTPVAEKDLNPIPSDFAESHKELNQFHPKGDESEKCDISDGEWVPNPGSPAYTNNSCRWIESHQNCMGNGRPDTDYLYWKWSPKACELPRFDAKKFLEMMRDKSWGFVGDSINRNHLQSYLCLLSQTLPLLPSLKDKDQVKKKKGCPETKKPATPYIMWCKEHWNEVKKDNPEAEFSEVANILGAKWKTLTPEEKKPYEEKYQIEKAIYSKIVGNEKRENEAMKLLEEEQKQKTAMELLEQYLQFKQEAEKEGDNKKNKKEKDPLKPKRPESAYFLFMNERRAALIAENKSMVEIAKIAGEEWKNMTEKQKVPFEKMAKKKNEKYIQEMEVYKQNKQEEAEIAKKEEDEVLKVLKHEALQLLKKKEKTETIIKETKDKKNKKKEEKKNKKVVDPNKPKRPASSFILFSKETRKDLAKEKPDISNAQVTALISVKWKELSEEEKQKWNSEAAEAMEAYKKEMEEYNRNAAAAADTPVIDDN